MRFHPSSLAFVLVSLAPALLCAAPADPLSIGAGHRAVFDERGVCRLETDKGALLSQCSLRLWTKDGYQTQANARAAEPPADGPAGRTFTGVIRFGGKSVQYWQTATAVPDGLFVQFAVAAGALADTDEVAACFELPQPTFADSTVTIEGGKPVALPAAQAAQPRLIEQDATTLTVERDGRGAGTPPVGGQSPARGDRGAGTPRLQFQRRPLGKIIVQDARQWGNPWFEAQLYARRAVGDPPGWRSVSFLLTVGKPAAGPLIAAVAPGKEAIKCHEVYEAEAVFWAPCENPFDPAQVSVSAEITAPSGKRPVAAGFYTRDYTRALVQDAEQLTPVGHGRWRVRMTTSEPGLHTCVIRVTTPAGTAESKPFAFKAFPSTGQRFLRAPKQQTAYLEYPNGEACFLIGHNYGWPPQKLGTFAVDAAFQRMANAGINATRLWLCTWGIHVEGTRPDDYRLEDAWRLDHLLRTAQERGLYVQLCLDNFQDLAAKENAPTNPYLAANGGPCQEPGQFFTLPKAREQHQRRLAYLAARYAPFTSVLAWELFNELAYATPNPSDPAVLDWVRSAADFLHRADPYGHPVTLGLGLRSAWDEPWRLPQIDIAQPHAYIRRPTDESRADDDRDSVPLILQQRDAVEAIGKPILVSEFGFLGTRDFNPLNEADKTGVHLHAALWAAALGGCAGTPLHWWWDTYIAQHDLYYHYGALAAFLRGTTFPGPGWRPFRSKAGSPVLVVGMRTKDAAILWVQHRDNGWVRRVVEQKRPVLLQSVVVDLPNLIAGTYRVEWWDTYAGQVITHTDTAVRDGVLSVRVPEGLPDVACKVARRP